MERPDATRKRQRKLYRACDPCTIAKARCEEVQATGCLRCRRRGERCSLAGLEVTRSLSPAVLASATQQEVISNLTARVQALEQSVNKTTFGIMAAPRLPPSPLDMALQLRQPDLDGFRKAICGEPSTTFFGERAFTVTKMDSYPDIIERGLMTKRQMDAAFTLFKQRFTLLFPLAPFLLASTPTPHHPFLRTAILSHVPEACPLNHYILVDESILFALTGSLSEDAMLALFILSLAPLHATSSHHVPPTPLRLVSLAYQFGQSLGLETRTRSRIRRGAGLDDEATLISALLWESVKQFYTVQILLYSQVDQYPTLRITDIPRPREDHYLRMHSFLSTQARFLTAVRTMADMLPDLEVGDGPLFADDVFIAWKLVLSTEESLMTADPEQGLTVRCILFSMALRMLMILTQRASDIHASPDYQNVPATAAEITIEAANALIRLFHSRSSSTIPAALMIAIVTAMAFLRRTVVLLQKLDVDPRLRVDLRSLELAERLVAGHEGLSGRVLRDIWGSLHEDKPEQAEIWDFDWSLLETFYQDLGNAS